MEWSFAHGRPLAIVCNLSSSSLASISWWPFCHLHSPRKRCLPSNDSATTSNSTGICCPFYRQIPYMAQRYAGKEGRCPTAQANWRRDIRSNGIAPTEQQIATCHQRHHGHCPVKHRIEAFSLCLMIVHGCALFRWMFASARDREIGHRRYSLSESDRRDPYPAIPSVPF